MRGDPTQESGISPDPVAAAENGAARNWFMRSAVAQRSAADQPNGRKKAFGVENPSGDSKALLWWSVVYCVMTIGWVVVVWFEEPGVGARAAVVGIAVALLVCYFTLGLRAVRVDSVRATSTFLVVFVGLVTGMMAFAPGGGVFFLIAYPMVWRYSSSTRSGVLWNFVLATVCFGGLLAFDNSDPLGTTIGMSAGLAFSLAIGVWVGPVFHRSQERAELIRQLHDAQARLAHTNREEGIAAERERLAREIHDTLAQGFLSIVMLSRAGEAEVIAASRSQKGDRAGASCDESVAEPAGLARFKMIEAAAEENLAEARALVAGFSPVGLDEFGLVETLQRLTDRFLAETGVPIHMSMGRDPAATVEGIAQTTAIVVVRAAQEALTNIRKHAEASTVEIVLKRLGDGSIQLVVSDDGVGIGQENRGSDVRPDRAGFGLSGMRDRVALVGGTVKAETPRGGGTRIQIMIPADELADGVSE